MTTRTPARWKRGRLHLRLALFAWACLLVLSMNASCMCMANLVYANEVETEEEDDDASKEGGGSEASYLKLSPSDMYHSKLLGEEVKQGLLQIYGQQVSELSSSLVEVSDTFDFSTQLFDRAQRALQKSKLAFIDSSVMKPTSDEEVGGDEAVELLRLSAILGHREGAALFGRLMLLGITGLGPTQDPEFPKKSERAWALRILLKSSELGSHLAQTYLGLLYSADAGKTRSGTHLLYLYMGASGGDALGQLALGWRHSLGLGVPKSCQAAVLYYDTPAYLVVEKAREPGSNLLGTPLKARISSKTVRWQKQKKEGILGNKMFDAVGRLVSKYMPNSDDRQETDMLQYYEYRASAGHAAAQTAMGEVFLSGSNGMPQDFKRAAAYFEQAYAGKDSEAAAQLGHLYANGLGVQQSNATAMKYFQKAADLGSAHGMYGLGYMFLSGFVEDNGGRVNTKTGEEVELPAAIDVDKAIYYLTKASDRGHVEAIFLLGVMYLNGWNANSKRIIAKVRDVIRRDDSHIALAKESDTHKAYHYLQVAAYAGHPIAMYNTAMMRLLGMGTSASCPAALEMLKPLAERLDPETKLLEYANSAVSNGELDSSALAYLLAGYSGMEVAQSNAAYLLQHINFDVVSAEGGDGEDGEKLAIDLHKYAAEQGNMASLLAIGDIFFYGYGTNRDREKAAAWYRAAAEQLKKDSPSSTLAGGRPRGAASSGDDDLELTPGQATAYAYFNLGVMHQMGIGLPQDLHLAKRFYDLAKVHGPDGPPTFALFALRAHKVLERVIPTVMKATETALDLVSELLGTAGPEETDTVQILPILVLSLFSVILPLVLLVLIMRLQGRGL